MIVSVEKQNPVKINNIASDCIVADFGKDAFARLEIEYDAEESAGEWLLSIGQVLTSDGHVEKEPGYWLIYRDMKWQPEAGTHNMFMNIPQHESPYQKTYQRSKVIAPEVGQGGEVAPFRYAEIKGKGIKAVKFVRHAMFGPFDDSAADFKCSDERLNKVWDFCKYSIKATSPFGIYIDGDRERQAFEGDTYINALGAYCTGGGYEIARRTITFLLDYYPICCLEYRLIMPALIRDYILYSGDEGMYKYWRDMLKERIELMEQYVQPDGLMHNCYKDFCISTEPGLENFHFKHRYEYFPQFPLNMQLLVDWPENERDGYEFDELNFIANAFYYMALNDLATLEPDGQYSSKAAILRDRIRQAFHKDNGLFVDSANSNHTALHTAMFAITLGLADADDIPALSSVIRSRGMACSVYGAQFLLDACYMIRMGDYGLELMRSEDKRSWINMMREGSTVSMEAWSKDFKFNLDWNHAWGAAPANLIPRRLCGIRPTAPGFSRFVVDPQPGNLEFFSIKHPTIHGPIIAEYVKGKLKLTVPEGTEAEFKGSIIKAGVHSLEL